MVLFAILGVVALYAASSLQGATPRQRAALALMEQPGNPAGRNAFAALWLLPYAVPEGELDAVADEDVRRFSARVAAASDVAAAAQEARYVSVAAARYPPQSEAAEALPLCRPPATGCLAQVRAQRDAYRRWRGRNLGLIERAGALSQYGHHRGRFAPSLAMPMPSIGKLIPTLLTDRALSFVEGRTDEALSQVCGDVSTWRRLAPQSDSLLVSMVGFSLAGDLTVLFAEMLAELPAGHPLPPACATAFAAPTVAEISLCEPLKGEFRFIRTAFSQWDRTQGLTGNSLFNRAMTDARSAAQMAHYCGVDVERALLADRPAPVQPAGERFRLDCVRNFAGCILIDIAAPSYRDYQLRAQDYGAKLRLAGTLLRLHQNPTDARPLAARLASRPAALRGDAREIEILEGGRALRVAMYGRRPAGHFQLPLTAYVSGGTSAD